MHSPTFQTTRRSPAMTALCAAVVLTVLGASTADALEGCKAKISAKDGAILVAAKDVSGVLEWGNAAGQAINSFANAATCVVETTANKCELGAPGSAQRITPPELCTIFLADGGGGTCSAFLKGCTPGLRTAGSGAGFVAKSGDVMSGTLRALSIDTGFGVTGCGPGDVCAFSRLISEFGGAQIGGELTLQDSIRQPSTNGGVVKAGLIVQCADAGSTIARFFNTTGTGAFGITGTDTGECTITTPFPITSRFFSATGISDTGSNMSEFLVTIDTPSSNQIRVRRTSESLGVMTGEDGPVSILIY